MPEAGQTALEIRERLSVLGFIQKVFSMFGQRSYARNLALLCGCMLALQSSSAHSQESVTIRAETALAVEASAGRHVLNEEVVEEQLFAVNAADAVEFADVLAEAVVAPPAPGAVCEVHELDGMVRRCCREVGPYTVFSNCTVFALTLHNICLEEGRECRSVSASCGGGARAGHRFNIVHLSDGLWYFVEPQSTGRPIRGEGFADPNAPSAKALCEMMGRPLNNDGTCPCTISQNSATPIPLNTNPVTACALNTTHRSQSQSIANYQSCLGCCRNRLQYHISNNIPMVPQWWSQCRDACRGNLAPTSVDNTTISNPGSNDSLAISHGRYCASQASFWSASSYHEQCRGCCLDGAQKGSYPRANFSSCMAVCNAQYR